MHDMRSCLLTLLLFGTGVLAQDAGNPFGRTLHVQSTAVGGAHKGEIRAVIDQPYGVVATALARPEHWCDILTLQVNIKRCEPSSAALVAFIARKPRVRVADTHRIDFRFEAAKRAD